MKQKDMPVLLAIIILSALVSVFFTNFVIVPKGKKNISVEKADTLSADFQKPDPTIFNTNAIDPTQNIKIGDNSNTGR